MHFFINFLEDMRMSQEMNVSNASPLPQSGLVERLFNVFVSPQKTFQALKIKPDWIVPALIFVIVMGLFGYLQTSNPGLIQAGKDIAIQKLEAKNMPQEQIDAAMAMGDKFRPFTPISTSIVPLIMFVFIGAGVWLFVGNTLLGGKARYGHMLSVTSYTLLITALGTLIKLPIMLAKSDLFVHFSLATFMPDASRETYLYKLLMSTTDLFSIWAMAVLSIGVAVVCDLKVNKVWPTVVIINVIVFALFALAM
jgi:hypothetical protein